MQLDTFWLPSRFGLVKIGSGNISSLYSWDLLRSRSTLGAREDDVLHLLLGHLVAVVNWFLLLPSTFKLSCWRRIVGSLAVLQGKAGHLPQTGTGRLLGELSKQDPVQSNLKFSHQAISQT